MSTAMPSFAIRRGLTTFSISCLDAYPTICRRQFLARSFSNAAGPSTAVARSARTLPSRTSPHRLASPTAWTQTRAASALTAKKTLPSEIVRVRRAPTTAELEEAEVDAELLAQADIQLRMTDRAGEQLRSIARREGDDGAALRIAVESGGCHGYQYKLELSSTANALPEDYILSHPTTGPGALIVDAVSLPLLNGSTVDFATELIGSSFRVVDNPQATGKGCGCGVSWELKL